MQPLKLDRCIDGKHTGQDGHNGVPRHGGAGGALLADGVDLRPTARNAGLRGTEKDKGDKRMETEKQRLLNNPRPITQVSMIPFYHQF